MPDMTNQQVIDTMTQQLKSIKDEALKHGSLLENLDNKVDSLGNKVDNLHSKVVGLTDMLGGVSDKVLDIVDIMATKDDLAQLGARLDDKFDNLELRLGRRIDGVILAQTAR